MCVVKVNRVESKSLGGSNKDTSCNSSCPASPGKNELKATVTDSQDPSRSRVSERTPEGLGSSPEATQGHLGINESRCCSSVPQVLNSSSHTGTYPDSEMDLCPLESGAHVSSSLSHSLTLDTDSRKHTSTINYTNDTVKTEEMDTVVDPKHMNSHSTTEALYDLKSEPAGGDSNTSAFFSSQQSDSTATDRNDESLLPPLLQRNTGDMPQLTLELTDRIEICPLPPILTQEMPSLTPAADELNDLPKSASGSHQIAPVLQRETPTGSPSSQEANEQEADAELSAGPGTVLHANHWHLELPDNCEEVTVSGLTGNTAHLPISGLHKIMSGDVHETLTTSAVASEKDQTKLENFSCGPNDNAPGQLDHRTAPESEPQPNLDVNKENSKDTTPRVLSGHTNKSPPTPDPTLCLQNNSHTALQLSHHTTHSSCNYAFQNPYTEPKPFSSSIWKNFSSQGPAVVIQSLHKELPSDFSHDPLPYTVWTEPQCKQVTDLEDPAKDLQRSENQEEAGGAPTWAQLEPTSLLTVGAIEPLGLCDEYDLQRDEVDEAVSLSLSRELCKQREEVSPIGAGGSEHDEESDMEDEDSDVELMDQQRHAKGQSSSDSSEEEDEDENDTNKYECEESSLEPGEVCAVSVLYAQLCCSDFHTSTACLTCSNFPCLCQYPILSAKRTTKSWRHPLRKPTARAVPTAVKQQAASDEGGLIFTNSPKHTRLI